MGELVYCRLQPFRSSYTREFIGFPENEFSQVIKHVCNILGIIPCKFLTADNVFTELLVLLIPKLRDQFIGCLQSYNCLPGIRVTNVNRCKSVTDFRAGVNLIVAILLSL